MVETPVEFSIAVLCYRAEEEIIPFVENLHKIMSLFRFEWELLLVANFWPGTDDRTPEICQRLAERLPFVRVLAEPKEGAMGWDMRRGLDACRGKYIGVIDGDGQFPVEAIFSCFAKIKSDDFDLVKTYRVRTPGQLLSEIYFDGLQPALSSFLSRLQQASGCELKAEDHDARSVRKDDAAV